MTTIVIVGAMKRIQVEEEEKKEKKSQTHYNTQNDDDDDVSLWTTIDYFRSFI